VNGHTWYYLAGLLDGAAAVYAITGWQMRRAAKRTAQQIAEIIQTGEEVIAESKARFPEPYDGEIQLPDERMHTTTRGKIAS
jgi:hypothetical protein